jgi:hypothetical protein
MWTPGFDDQLFILQLMQPPCYTSQVTHKSLLTMRHELVRLCSQLPRWLNLTWVSWADCSRSMVTADWSPPWFDSWVPTQTANCSSLLTHCSDPSSLCIAFCFLKVRVTSRLTVSLSVLVSSPVRGSWPDNHSGLKSYSPVHMGRPLWREVGSIFCQS